MTRQLVIALALFAAACAEAKQDAYDRGLHCVGLMPEYVTLEDALQQSGLYAEGAEQSGLDLGRHYMNEMLIRGGAEGKSRQIIAADMTRSIDESEAEHAEFLASKPDADEYKDYADRVFSEVTTCIDDL